MNERLSNAAAAGREVIVLEHTTVVRPGGLTVWRDLSWTVHEGETWAITGPVASGKTTLAEVVTGKMPLAAGAVRWPFIDRLPAGRSTAWPSDVIQHLSFREDSWLFSYSRHYYQQRFNFIEPQDDLTLDTFLRSGPAASEDALRMTAERLGIADLLTLSLIKLSNGQMRRARIARALLSHPELLILDDPFLGLDVAGRAEVTDILGGLVQQGQRLLLIARPDAVPGWVTNVLQLGTEIHEPRPSNEPRPLGSGVADRSLTVAARNTPIIELCNVTVAYGDRIALRDVSWQVRPGERWALLGPNGSGKTTLLSLLCGDHPQAYSNDVRLFGRRRGSGESIWEIKERVGLVSPELHLYFSEPLTALQTVATGFFDALVCRPTTAEQDAVVRDLFDTFEITALGNRLFSQLSTGEQRLVLLIRGLVKQPPLLILDEPFQGLDQRMTEKLRGWFDQRLRPDQTVLLVTHHVDEIPRTVTRRLQLEQGRVVTTA